MTEISTEASLKRIARAYGCAKRDSPEEDQLLALLLCKVNEERKAPVSLDDLQQFDKAKHLLASLVEYAELTDSCEICGELLDKPDNDFGDGELLGHTHDCPVAEAKELLGPAPSANDDEPSQSESPTVDWFAESDPEETS